MSAMMQTEAMSQAEARNAFEAALRAHRGIVLKVANSYASLPEDRADLAQAFTFALQSLVRDGRFAEIFARYFPRSFY